MESGGQTDQLLLPEKLLTKQNKNMRKIVTQKTTNLLTQQEQSQIEEKKFVDRKNDLSTRMSTSYDPDRSQELIPKIIKMKKRSNSYNRSIMQRQKSVILTPHINKQIFYGAFHEQFNMLYKNLGEVMDLDSYYLRSFRRQKQELKDQIVLNRINQVVNFSVKNMPKIQKAINSYNKNYVKYCPYQIKSFHSQGKIIVHESEKRLKSQSLQKSYKVKLGLSQKMKSEENYEKTQQVQNLFKNNTSYRLRQRNKSFHQNMVKKQSLQKPIIQTRLPTVYNPELFYLNDPLESERMINLHQKVQNLKFSVNGIKNKGLLRYKKMNKDRNKSVLESDDFLEENKVNEISITQFIGKKQPQHEPVSIRKLLKLRQKQRFLINRTPVSTSFNIQKQEIDTMMAEIKAINTQRLRNKKSINKYEVFLSTLKQSSPQLGFKLNQKFRKLNPQKQVQFPLSSRNKQSDYLPKII